VQATRRGQGSDSKAADERPPLRHQRHQLFLLYDLQLPFSRYCIEPATFDPATSNIISTILGDRFLSFAIAATLKIPAPLRVVEAAGICLSDKTRSRRYMTS
jgi:hypothetical protein